MNFVNDILLAPYSLLLRFRHFLYNHGIRKVRKSAVPSICIGNIAAGGTGKTPHTEMLLRMLASRPRFEGGRFAVLSRGYKRRTKGFLEVTADGSAKVFGDEPLQIKKKFPEVAVAVDKNRVRGCAMLCERESPDLILLEDAFQYRALKADVSIVLVDYNRPVFKDHLLPAGRLRDLPSRLKAADIVIVSKCPTYLWDEDRDEFAAKLKFKGDIFFTSVFYAPYKAVFPEGDSHYLHAKRLILFTGIANDTPLFNYLEMQFRIVSHFRFGDHHRYRARDWNMIRKAAGQFETAVIMTTEKDAQRVLDCPEIPAVIKERLFYAPVYTDFIAEGEAERFIEAALNRLRPETTD